MPVLNFGLCFLILFLQHCRDQSKVKRPKQEYYRAWRKWQGIIIIYKYNLSQLQCICVCVSLCVCVNKHTKSIIGTKKTVQPWPLETLSPTFPPAPAVVLIRRSNFNHPDPSKPHSKSTEFVTLSSNFVIPMSFAVGTPIYLLRHLFVEAAPRHSKHSPNNFNYNQWISDCSWCLVTHNTNPHSVWSLILVCDSWSFSCSIESQEFTQKMFDRQKFWNRKRVSKNIRKRLALAPWDSFANLSSNSCASRFGVFHLNGTTLATRTRWPMWFICVFAQTVPPVNMTKKTGQTCQRTLDWF